MPLDYKQLAAKVFDAVTSHVARELGTLRGDISRDLSALDARIVAASMPNVRECIDPSESYANGTWARHQGGIVQAFRATDPMPADRDDIESCGWRVLVVGIARFIARPTDTEREYTLEVVTTGGKRIDVLTALLPAMIYRGVWDDFAKRGKPYTRGDTVTSKGSLWHCEAESTTAEPETSPDWKLCVKRGRDGKDAQDARLGPGAER